ncbi:WAT1-related protein At5g47470-like isoform X2 [Macadamia integrifolia]|uniref:WAT1-related protein At5g47470-like isoform X2 n=1 Tax=Macadamia integrifolia TaxID=60698 RepID=UPI001C4F1E3D|nr:WAT1-related protein At5g47470-like isoform X2 [Macadamia integrifolia]
MFRLSRGEFLEEFTIIAGLVIVQGVYGFYAVFTSYIMSIGIGSLFLIIYGSFATFIILLPLSIFFERVMFQGLMLMGIKRTSPTVAAAMPNLAPGFIFLIAWSLGLEKVNPKCLYSKVKILGTLGCITGALAMSFFHVPETSQALVVPASLDKDMIIGCLCLIGAVFILSCNCILQAQAMMNFPAPMSLSAVSALIGAILTGIVQFIQEHRFSFDWPLVNFRILIGAALVGGIVGGGCTSFNTWTMKKRGPVFVSMFSPIGTVFSVVIACLTIGDSITIGSVFGMLLTFTGLYIVLWAKKNEDTIFMEKANGTTKASDPELPLLS